MVYAEQGRITIDTKQIHKSHTKSTDISDALVIRENDLSLVTKPNGDIPIWKNFGYGLYFRDCRFLSGYIFKINGMSPTGVLSSDQDVFHSTIVMTNPDFKDRHGTFVPKETMGIRREKAIPGSILEDITVENFNQFKVSVDVSLEFDSDFDDIFTVRGITSGNPDKVLIKKYKDGILDLSYTGLDHRLRSTKIKFIPPPSRVEESTCFFSFDLEPHGFKDIILGIFVEDTPPGQLPQMAISSVDLEKNLEDVQKSYVALMRRSFDFRTDNNVFGNVLLRCLSDLRMLHMNLKDDVFHSAGVPWYDALFGRDSIIAAIQVLPYISDTARSTLRLLARYQGTVVDDWRDEEPGKILHELRVGEMANIHAIPQTPYYGTVDATPMFLILLSEYVNWTGDMKLFNDMLGNVDAALNWIDNYADLQGNGFTSYKARSTRGIGNQGWKDSYDSISRSDGSLAKPPVALAEVQGYVYMAKERIGDLYSTTGKKQEAERLKKESRDLKKKFNDVFWMEDKKFYAQAIDSEGVCDVISSNPAQGLWTGIIDEGHAADLVDRIFERDMFSGWGIRTLSSVERRYNPLAYHNGTMWPHDNSIIAAGLTRYGFYDKAEALFTSVYDAAGLEELYRLPELFGGSQRGPYSKPIKYPVANRPQAWSAGSIPFMLASCLGFMPDALNRRLILKKPRLPPWLNKISMNNITVGGISTEILFSRQDNETLVDVVNKGGDLEVLVSY
ncbi:MAG: amylo-alpha-1,6-glucosidase [Methanocella sp.]